MIVTALALLLLSQDGTCKPGMTCRSYAFQPPCVATASLPACATSTKGRTMCDVTSNCWKYCNGSAWSCVATALTNPSTGWQTDGGSTATTPEGLRVEVGGGGVRTDGGVYTYGSDVDCRGGSVYARDTGGGSTYIRLVVSGANHYFDNASSTMFVCSSATGICTFGYRIASNSDVTAGSYLEAGSYVKAVTYLRTVGVATGSLPTCNSGIYGAIIYDTTVAKLKVCTSAASGTWETITSV